MSALERFIDGPQLLAIAHSNFVQQVGKVFLNALHGQGSRFEFTTAILLTRFAQLATQPCERLALGNAQFGAHIQRGR